MDILVAKSALLSALAFICWRQARSVIELHLLTSTINLYQFFAPFSRLLSFFLKGGSRWEEWRLVSLSLGLWGLLSCLNAVRRLKTMGSFLLKKNTENMRPCWKRASWMIWGWGKMQSCGASGTTIFIFYNGFRLSFYLRSDCKIKPITQQLLLREKLSTLGRKAAQSASCPLISEKLHSLP